MKLGIDFGTCYSSAALLIDGVLRPAKEPLKPLESCFPSSVCVNKRGEIVISQAAENQRRLNPQGYKTHFKRDLETDIPYFLGEQQLRFMPEELVTIMLTGLKKEAEKIVNSSLNSAIITVPATYLMNKKKLMEEAGKKAGFTEVTLLEEPVAAAIYYSQKGTMGHQLNDNDILLIYDLGGGTFDAALIQKKGNSYELLCQPVGDKQCGGIYFDQFIAQDFIKQLQEDSIRELLTSHRQDQEALRAKLNLLDWCRNFKHQLSMVDEYEDFPPVGLDSYSLSREKFEEMITPFIDSSCNFCQQLVQQSRIKWESINRVLLVGGSCRIPLVQKRLEQQFNRPVVAIDDPELAICFGAAIYGTMPTPDDERKRKEQERLELETHKKEAELQRQKQEEAKRQSELEAKEEHDRRERERLEIEAKVKVEFERKRQEQDELERQRREGEAEIQRQREEEAKRQSELEAEKESDEEWWQKYETDIDQYESPDEDDEEWWQKYEDEEWWQKYETDIDQYESPDKHKQPATIYVGNLHNEVTAENIKEVFSDYGHVEQVDLKRGYAFVKMANLTESLNAINALDGAEWMGRDLKVEKAKSDH